MQVVCLSGVLAGAAVLKAWMRGHSMGSETGQKNKKSLVYRSINGTLG